MSHFPLMLQPFPEACPIPQGVVALIGGYVGKRPMFALWRDGKQIIIEAPPMTYSSKSLDQTNCYHEWYATCEERQTYANYLEIIQSHLLSINFDATNWGYLVQDKKGNYYITQRQMVLNCIPCPPGETLIQVHEIEFTVFGTCSDRRGIWRNKKVDVLYGWNDTELKAVKQSIRGYKALQAKGLSHMIYEVYGHLVGRDGSVIGLVSEAASGRMICSSDMALVYSAISRLENAGFLYRGCSTNRFMIYDNTVRLLELNCIVPYKDREKLSRETDRWHWTDLRELFKELEKGIHIDPPLRLTMSWKNIECVLPKASPERPLGIRIHVKFFSNYFLNPLENHYMLKRIQAIKYRVRSNRQNRRLQLAHDEYDEPKDPDMPVTIARVRGPSIPICNPRNRLTEPYDPRYHRRRSMRTPVASESDTLSTSSSTTAVTHLSTKTLDSTSSSETLVTEETSQVDYDRAIIPTISGEPFDDGIISKVVSPALSPDQHSPDCIDIFFNMVDEVDPALLFGLSSYKS
ncbi:hypothetical protein HYPSUDRAFT_183326 [Hypholoma sublateritium FD-334 SS-4]|uniref:Uncharacterized protein n=1 Tax=Hypholoma sublateritium (strain FD-334 SS-4) TaxID=945553 RepID=A0A0D2MM04_HYPSF|nr:hypothetical protein HYPSUDRAFT_183326 [Hypholoma sublateritium FD-334 SS-4]